MDIKEVLIADKELEYLKKRNLLKQYIKAKSFIVTGKTNLVHLKLRQPKREGIYYFRINNQYRAFAFLENGILKVFKIDNHQN